MTPVRRTPIETWGVRVEPADRRAARAANARLARAEAKLAQLRALLLKHGGRTPIAAPELDACERALAAARVVALCPYCAGAPSLRRGCSECSGTAFVGAIVIAGCSQQLLRRPKLVFVRGRLMPLTAVLRGSV